MAYDFTNKLFMAPLAGVTDAAFRLLCREFGADLCYTEMISANGIKYGNKKTADMLFSFPGEGKKAGQFFGPDAETILSVVDFIKDQERLACLNFALREQFKFPDNPLYIKVIIENGGELVARLKVNVAYIAEVFCSEIL